MILSRYMNQKINTDQLHSLMRYPTKYFYIILFFNLLYVNIHAQELGEGEAMLMQTVVVNTTNVPNDSIVYQIMLKGEKWGLQKADGTMVLPCNYDGVYLASATEEGEDEALTPSMEHLGLFYYIKNDSIGIFNGRNGRLLPARFAYCALLQDADYIMVKETADGLYAVFSLELEQLTDFNISWLQPANRHMLIATINDVFFLVGTKGLVNIPPSDGIFAEPMHSYLLFYSGDRWGALDSLGKLIIEPTYSYLEGFSNNTIKASLYEDRFVLFNDRGRQITTDTFIEATEIAPKYIQVTKSYTLKGVVHTDGYYSIRPDSNLDYCTDKLCTFVENGRYGVKKLDGTILIDPVYDLAYTDYSCPGYFLLKKGDKFRYLNPEGHWLNNDSYDFGKAFINGLALVRSFGKWGYIDTSGRVAIPMIFDYADNFNAELNCAIVLKDNQYGFIDSIGEQVEGSLYPGKNEIPVGELFSSYVHKVGDSAKGDGLKDFFEDVWLLPPTGYLFSRPANGIVVYAELKDDSYCLYPPYGLMNYAGQALTPPVYERIDDGHLKVSDMIPVKKDGKWGFIDTKGRVQVPMMYDGVWNLEQPWENGEWRGGVTKENKSWVIDRDGRKMRDE